MLFKDYVKIMHNYIGIGETNPNFISFLIEKINIDGESCGLDKLKPGTLSDIYEGKRNIAKTKAKEILAAYDDYGLITELNEITDSAINDLIIELKNNGINAAEDTINEKCSDLLKIYIKSFADGIKDYDITEFKKKEQAKRRVKESKKTIEDIIEPLRNDFETYDLADAIDRHRKVFVSTKSFYSALNKIRTNRCLMIVGDPGIGKSTISEMIVLDYLKQDFKVKVLSIADDFSAALEEIKHEEDKEIIYIDDCLGEAYYSLNVTQENGLKRLISYIRIASNKVLLLNSRITIKNGVIDNQIIGKELKRLDCDELIFEVKEMEEFEKVALLYSHLLQSPYITNEHYSVLRSNERYQTIVKHDNFNPRLIEYITSKLFLEGIEIKDYFKTIMQKLDNPSEIWDSEYNNKLTKKDRYLLIALYSLGQRSVDIGLCKKAYEKMLENDGTIDLTRNNFDSSIKVLNNSMVRVVVGNNRREIQIANPSIDDFLCNNVVTKDTALINVARKSIISYNQIDRLYDLVERYDATKKMLEDGSILKLIYESKQVMNEEITHDITINGVCDDRYRQIIKDFLNMRGDKEKAFYPFVYKTDTFLLFLSDKKLFEFYIGKKFGVDLFLFHSNVADYTFDRLCATLETINCHKHIANIEDFAKGEVLEQLFNNSMETDRMYSGEFDDIVFTYYDDWSNEDINNELVSRAREINHKCLYESAGLIPNKIYEKLDDLIENYNYDFMDYIDSTASVFSDDSKMLEYEEEYKLYHSDIYNLFNKEKIK